MAYEDFTTYTEVDSEGSLAIIANKITITDIDAVNGSWVVDDKGINHFDGDFTHLVEVQCSFDEDWSWFAGYMLANSVDDFITILDDVSGEAVMVWFRRDAGGNNAIIQFLVEDPDTNIDPTAWNLPVADTTYYLTIDRDDDGGSSSKGRYTLYIRTGSHAGVLIDTLVVDVDAQLDLRYAYGVASGVVGDRAGVLDGFVQNLDLQEPGNPYYAYAQQ